MLLRCRAAATKLGSRVDGSLTVIQVSTSCCWPKASVSKVLTSIGDTLRGRDNQRCQCQPAVSTPASRRRVGGGCRAWLDLRRAYRRVFELHRFHHACAVQTSRVATSGKPSSLGQARLTASSAWISCTSTSGSARTRRQRWRSRYYRRYACSSTPRVRRLASEAPRGYT